MLSFCNELFAFVLTLEYVLSITVPLGNLADVSVGILLNAIVPLVSVVTTFDGKDCNAEFALALTVA